MSQNEHILIRSVLAGVLLLYSLYHGFTTFRYSISQFRSGSIDPITASEIRFAPLKASLSHSEKVGYVTDLPTNGDWFIEYYHAQYTLAPTIVENSTDNQFVVGNIHDPSSLARISHDDDLSVVSSFGNGVYLLSRKRP